MKEWVVCSLVAIVGSVIFVFCLLEGTQKLIDGIIDQGCPVTSTRVEIR